MWNSCIPGQLWSKRRSNLSVLLPHPSMLPSALTSVFPLRRGLQVLVRLLSWLSPFTAVTAVMNGSRLFERDLGYLWITKLKPKTPSFRWGVVKPLITILSLPVRTLWWVRTSLRFQNLSRIILTVLSFWLKLGNKIAYLYFMRCYKTLSYNNSCHKCCPSMCVINQTEYIACS